jgi:hypothetical protein
MSELLNDILKVVLAAAIPVIAAFAKLHLDKLAALAASKTNSELIHMAIEEVGKMAGGAVSTVNQHMVDALKLAEKFTPEAATYALKEALQIVTLTVSEDAKTMLGGAFRAIAESKIEEQVRAQKFVTDSMNGMFPRFGDLDEDFK